MAGVIIADQMGLGKSLQAIALAKKHNLRTLIICPASLKVNWTRELYKFTSLIPHYIYSREISDEDYLELLADKKHQFTIINYDLLGNELEYKKDYSTHYKFPWVDVINMSNYDLIVCDEAHYGKNVDSKRSRALRGLKAKHYMFLTGTPVLNRPGELWPMLNIINPTQFPAYQTFLNQYTWDGVTARNVEELRELLKTIMIRRLTKDVMKDLPEVQRITLEKDLSPKAAKLYQKVLNGIWYDLQGEKVSITAIIAQIQRLKQVCAIDKVQWAADKAIELYDSSEGDTHRKVIIFSQYKLVANAIHRLLGHESVYLTGLPDMTVDQRQEQVDIFQNNPDIHFATCTTKSVSEGLTMTAAGFVLNVDYLWTPGGHEQAEGRAYGRQNDPHGIKSYYLHSKLNGEETIEDWISSLLNLKEEVIAETVDGVEASRNINIATELVNKLKDGMFKRK